MPLYFAYGANMDEAAMHMRCPKSQFLGPARLARHRFGLMADGFATIVRDGARQVHGVLYNLALSDMAALDRFEEVARGLYVKCQQPVLRSNGAPARALVYIGAAGASETPKIIAGYLENVIAGAQAAQLPQTYIASLTGLLSGGTLRGQTRAIKWPLAVARDEAAR